MAPVQPPCRRLCARMRAYTSAHDEMAEIETERQKQPMSKRFVLQLAVMLCSLPALATISTRMYNYEFTGAEYVGYYLLRWVYVFQGYPFVVQASVTVLMFSILMVAFLTIRIVLDKYKNSRHEKFYRKLKRRYGDILLKIFADKHNYTDQEVLELTNYKDEGWKGWRMFFVGRLLVETKSEVYDVYNYRNVEAVVRVFGLYGFVENKLTFGSYHDRIMSLQLSQFLMIDVAESILVRLLSSTSHMVRKEVRMFYVWLSEYEPFRFFIDKNVDYEYRPWDSLEVHHMLRARKLGGKEIPSLVPIVHHCPDPQLKSCLIREVAYWGTYEDINKMRVYITADNTLYRSAAIQCMGIAKFAYAEQALEQAYSQQTEELKELTLYTILRIRSGKALPFYVGAYGESTVATTKFAILMCMYWYNEESRETFELLESSADENDLLLFKEVRAVLVDPMIE